MLSPTPHTYYKSMKNCFFFQIQEKKDKKENDTQKRNDDKTK